MSAAGLTRRAASLALCAAVAVNAAAAQVPWPPAVRKEWASIFARHGAEGTFLLAPDGGGPMSVHDPVRAQRRFLPASTFKIPHALIALDEGVVRDEHETFAWDGKKRSIEAWNQSQTLAQAMKHSTVWVFQEIARRLGETREQAWFDKLNYGNRDMSGGLTQFWLDGGLRISAAEQIAFLSQLRALKLPASERSQRIVRHITLIEAARDYAVFGKTGWAQPEGAAKGLGWLVGWVDREDRHAVFALNMEMSAMRDAPKRLAITRDILRADGWLAAG